MNNWGNLPNQVSNNIPMAHQNKEIKATSTLLKRKSKSLFKKHWEILNQQSIGFEMDRAHFSQKHLHRSVT